MSCDMTDSELTAVLLRVVPFVAKPYLDMARAAIEADRARQLVRAEPWLKSGDVQDRLESGK